MSSDVPFPLSSDSLFYKGKYYALTDERIPYMRDKTVNEKFFVLTLFAIAYELLYSEKYMPGMTTAVDLAIGLPPGHFGKQYKEFEKYFVKHEITDFEFNQKRFKILINSATAYPQGYAAVMPMYSKVKEYPRSVIIDIGGYSLVIILIRLYTLFLDTYSTSSPKEKQRFIASNFNIARISYGYLNRT